MSPREITKMNDSNDPMVRLHLRLGWWGMLAFLSMGAGLELLHALKLGFYLDVGNDTRRMLWTLAHAHGTLLAMLQFGFVLTLVLIPEWEGKGREWASRGLMASLLLVPGGFFLGGLFIHRGDPGLGIFLLPIGFVLLFVGVLRTAQGVEASGSE